MRILATNDDGVGAAGLWESVRMLRELGEVMVVAPSGDHSGAGAGILWHQRMAYRQIRPRRKGCEDVPTYIVYNTPAAAVTIGVEWLAKRKVDLVVSGINDGSNVGRDSLLSGTVGAAVAAAMMGIPSVAISQARRNSADPVRSQQDGPAGHREVGCWRTHQCRGLILSVNAPYCRPDEIRGVVRVQPADMHVFRRTTFDGERSVGNGVMKVKAGYRPMDWNGKEGTDIWALSRKYVTVELLRPELVREAETTAGRSLVDRLNAEILAMDLPSA